MSAWVHTSGGIGSTIEATAPKTLSPEGSRESEKGSATESAPIPEQESRRVVYSCRLCRRAVFNEGDIERHETAQHSFHRRKSKGVTTNGACSSIFLTEPSRWMKRQAGQTEGKLSCPNPKCQARLGSLKWTGAQCSCGSWITPAIQFPRKNLDVRFATPVGPAPGTVLHSSLVSDGRDHDAKAPAQIKTVDGVGADPEAAAATPVVLYHSGGQTVGENSEGVHSDGGSGGPRESEEEDDEEEATGVAMNATAQR